MPWIKRNLPFLIGSAAALALLIVAGWYCYVKWQLNRSNLAALDDAYNQLRQTLNSNYGNKDIDNIAIARTYHTNVLQAIDKARKHFQTIRPIPDLPQIENRDFFTALRATIGQMREVASDASVTLPGADYDFTFRAQQQLISFAPGSTPLLAAQLGEIKAICDVLFKARINAIYSIQRERVSQDDLKGPPSNYVETQSVTNAVGGAVLVPYEVSFFCFSGELANVLAGFANSQHGFIIKTINVEAGGTAATGELDGGGVVEMDAIPQQMYAPPPEPAPRTDVPPYMRARRPDPAVPVQPVVTPVAVPISPAPTATSGSKGLPVEKQLKVTMALDVVRLLPAK